MSVQRTATARNQRAERVSLYLLTRHSELVGGQPPVPQARFSSSIAQDIWDTKFEFDSDSEKLEVWSQTTCYKGHTNASRAEPNKGYEFRETISELLSLRASHPSPKRLRTVHITYGNFRYAYPWMHAFKALAFDCSIVVNLVGVDIHEAIEDSIGLILLESQVFKKLDEERESCSPLGQALDGALEKLSEWHAAGMTASKTGLELAAIVATNMTSIDLSNSLDGSPISIKGRIVRILLGTASEPIDPALQDAADRFMKLKPFLRATRTYFSDWPKFALDIDELPRHSLEEFIHAGWQSSNHDLRALFRRLVARSGFVGDVDYVQDFNVAGITEHNLYGEDHSESQASQIVEILLRRLTGIEPNELAHSMTTNGRVVLAPLIDYEVRNGTNADHAKSVIHEQVRSWGFEVADSPTRAGHPAIGVHVHVLAALEADKSESAPQQFNNFSLVFARDGSPLAYLKAKYFRQQEFERRAKEEAFVGLTLVSGWDGVVKKNETAIPVIMYVDTDDDPSTVKVKRSLAKLQAFGWLTCLGSDDLKVTLDRLQDDKGRHE